jgi:hypothetical protein
MAKKPRLELVFSNVNSPVVLEVVTDSSIGANEIGTFPWSLFAAGSIAFQELAIFAFATGVPRSSMIRPCIF